MAKTLGTPEIMRDRPFRRNSSAVAPCRWPIFALVVMMFLECVRAEVVNTQVVRKIDLTTQVAKVRFGGWGGGRFRCGVHCCLMLLSSVVVVVCPVLVVRCAQLPHDFIAVVEIVAQKIRFAVWSYAPSIEMPPPLIRSGGTRQRASNILPCLPRARWTLLSTGYQTNSSITPIFL